MVPGAKVMLRGQEFEIPPLTFGQIKRLTDKINSLSQISGNLTPDQASAILDVVHAAMSTNYPDMTLEKMEELLDLANLPTVVLAVMGQSGLIGGAEGKPTAAGS